MRSSVPKKPPPHAIRSAQALTASPARGADPILVCNVCGRPAEVLTVWRECDEQDNPLRGPGALVFLGKDGEHVLCKIALDDHPRLYTEESGLPGTFPRLCGACPYRRGFECSHPKLKKNGGPGLNVKLDGAIFANAIICTTRGRYRHVHNAVSCEGRSETGLA